jgi:membrane protease YdiL (CAAX protease family)
MTLNHPVWLYYFWSLFISWIILSPLVLNQLFQTQIYTLPYHHFWAAVGPLLAACLATWQLKKSMGLKNLLHRVFAVDIKMKWYVLALLLPALLFLISVLLSSEKITFNAINTFADFGAIGFGWGWLIHVLTFGVGEEVGWRGYLLPLLRKKLNPFMATLILTGMWAFWHVPMFFYRTGYLDTDLFFIVGWSLSLLMGSLFLTWIYENSGQKTMVCILFHGTLNAFFTMQASQGNITNLMGAMLTIIVLCLLILDRKFYFSSHLPV